MKLALSGMVAAILLLTSCASAEKGQMDQVETSSAQQQIIIPVESDDEDSFTAERYLAPLYYELGSTSWSDPEKAMADGFVSFFMGLVSEGLVELDPEGPRDEVHGNLLMPAELLEAEVQKYFTVSTGHIRSSQYYDPERNAYWTGGIGSTATLELLSEKQVDDVLVLHYGANIFSSDYHAKWQGYVYLSVREGEDTYEYLCHDRSAVKESGDLRGYEQYVRPFSYELGTASWETAADAPVDGLVSYYVYQAIFQADNNQEMPPLESRTPQGQLESFVCGRFGVEPEAIRASRYYLEEEQAYRTENLNPLAVLTITEALSNGDDLFITFTADTDTDTSTGHITMNRYADGRIEYLSFRKNQPK